MIDQITQEFVTKLRSHLGRSLKRVVLFGSRARGDQHEGSDYDMLVVVDQRTPRIRSFILNLEAALMDRYNVLIATILRSEQEWQRSQGLPLARNIVREGLSL